VARAKRTVKSKPARLDERLVLNTFINRLFGVKSSEEFQKKLLKDVEDGFDEEGRSFVFERLRSHILHSQNGTGDSWDVKRGWVETLEEYDSNIKSYVDHISAKQETTTPEVFPVSVRTLHRDIP